MSASTANATAAAAAAATEDEQFAELFAQAHALDARMDEMRERYLGKVIVFYGGRVICAADTDEEAIAHIPDDMRDLQLIIRRIELDTGPDFMGGPIEG